MLSSQGKFRRRGGGHAGRRQAVAEAVHGRVQRHAVVEREALRAVNALAPRGVPAEASGGIGLSNGDLATAASHWVLWQERGWKHHLQGRRQGIPVHWLPFRARGENGHLGRHEVPEAFKLCQRLLDGKSALRDLGHRGRRGGGQPHVQLPYYPLGKLQVLIGRLRRARLLLERSGYGNSRAPQMPGSLVQPACRRQEVCGNGEGAPLHLCCQVVQVHPGVGKELGESRLPVKAIWRPRHQAGLVTLPRGIIPLLARLHHLGKASRLGAKEGRLQNEGGSRRLGIMPRVWHRGRPPARVGIATEAPMRARSLAIPAGKRLWCFLLAFPLGTLLLHLLVRQEADVVPAGQLVRPRLPLLIVLRHGAGWHADASGQMAHRAPAVRRLLSTIRASEELGKRPRSRWAAALRRGSSGSAAGPGEGVLGDQRGIILLSIWHHLNGPAVLQPARGLGILVWLPVHGNGSPWHGH